MPASSMHHLETEEIPQDWKLADVTPLHKKGDRSCASNYEPISLTSTNIRGTREHNFRQKI